MHRENNLSELHTIAEKTVSSQKEMETHRGGRSLNTYGCAFLFFIFTQPTEGCIYTKKDQSFTM